MPGESRELALDPLPADATVQVVAAVLEDGTAMGEEPLIAAVFGPLYESFSKMKL